MGIRFSTVAADILGPVTIAAKSRAKHILVMTDLFTKFAIAVPLVSTDSAEVAREIVESLEPRMFCIPIKEKTLGAT